MQKIYFLAILPTPAIQSEVTAFKFIARDRFNSSHALKSPAHITIIPPQRWESSRVDWVKDHLGSWIANQKPFTITINGFAAFEPRVVFLRIEENGPLNDFQQGCVRFISHLLEKKEERPFHPRMTVAFKDLDRRRFAEAWKYFMEKVYLATFEVDALHLLHHTGGRWEIMGRWLLGKPDGFIQG